MEKHAHASHLSTRCSSGHDLYLSTALPPAERLAEKGHHHCCNMNSEPPSRFYPWKYITDEFIQSPGTLKNTLLSRLSSKDIQIEDVFYEILLSVSEFPERVSRPMLLQLLSEVIANINQVEVRARESENFILLAQAFKMSKNMSSFIKDCSIDVRFKILHLDKLILKSEAIFPDYGKYQYNDARNRIFSVDSYSSLHEASEGYAKFISQIFSYLDLQPNDHAHIAILIDVLNRIIAEFNLDNSRCFLLLLNILSGHVEKNEPLVLSILQQSPWWNLSEYNTSMQTTIVDYLLNYVGIECKELILITLLIKHKILEFDSIYNSLGPFDFSLIDSSSIKLIQNNEFSELYDATQKEILRKSQISSASALALAAPLIPDSDEEEEDDRRMQTTNSKNDDLKDSKVETEPNPEVSILEKAKFFRKVSFLKHLIDYEMIDEILLVLTQYPQIPLISDPVADKLNSLVNKIISPFYFEFVGNLNITTNDTLGTKMGPISVTTIDEFLSSTIKFIFFNRHKVARNSSLLYKLIRVMKKALASGLKDSDFWLQFYRIYIFPCLSFTNNIPLANEAFDILLSHYPLETRYNLYGDYQLSVKRDPLTKLNYDTAEKKTRNLLKRLSVENVQAVSRSLNKLCSINPLAVSNAFISHIESYSSLIDLVCQSSEFFNDFAWDVITFQILNKLNSNRVAIQSDGLNYSPWFANISQFIGKLGKSYPESFQLSPILLCIVKSLTLGDTNILSVVKELLDSMTGIKSIANLTTKQIMRLNAETSLKRFAYMGIQDNRENCVRSCLKLLETLMHDKLFAELFVLLCHLPTSLIDKADDKPLKFVNQKCDEVSSLIHVLTEALGSHLDTSLFEANMIPILSLIKDYKIQPQWAFEIWRTQWSNEIKMNGNSGKSVFEEFKTPFEEHMSKVDWGSLSSGFYFTFWQLSLYDINFNDLSYMMEYSDLRSQITGINMKLRQQKRELAPKEARALEEKSNELMSILTHIREDMNIHESNFKLVIDRLENEKSKWFKDDAEANPEILKEKANKRALTFLEHCALPRLQHSSFDAVFVSKFIFFLNTFKVPGYSLKVILDKFFMLDILPITLFIDTAMETENLALFYQLTLEKLHDWWANPEIYQKESNNMDEELDHEAYRKVLYKWHENLFRQIMKSLRSTSYTTRNNAILFLKVILLNFPVVEELADLLTGKLEEIANEDSRDDIKLASRALIGLIKFKQSKFISVWQFYEMDEEAKAKAMKAKEEKDMAEKQRLEELEKKRLEEEKKEREKLVFEQANKAGSVKPYGLVGLVSRSSKKEEPVEKAKEKEKNETETPTKKDSAGTTVEPAENKVVSSVKMEIDSKPAEGKPGDSRAVKNKTAGKSDDKPEGKAAEKPEDKKNTASKNSKKESAKDGKQHGKTATPAAPASKDVKRVGLNNLPKSPSSVRSPSGPAASASSHARQADTKNRDSRDGRDSRDSRDSRESNSGGRWGRYRNEPQRYHDTAGSGGYATGPNPSAYGNKSQYYGGQDRAERPDRRDRGHYLFNKEGNGNGSGNGNSTSSRDSSYYGNASSGAASGPNSNDKRSGSFSQYNGGPPARSSRGGNGSSRDSKPSQMPQPLPPPATPPPPPVSSSSSASSSGNGGHKRRHGGNDYYGSGGAGSTSNNYSYKRARRQ